MSLYNERHVDTDRAGDAQGGGNYATLMDFMNQKLITVAPFNETTISVVAAQHVLIDSSMVTGNLAIGGSATDETDGGVVAASLAGAIGTANTTAINDGLGNVTNLVEVREEDTHDSLLDTNGRKIYGLFQAASTSVDSDAIGAAASENCQVSFVIIAADGTVTLTAVTADIEIAVPKLYASRHLPAYRKEGSNAEAEVTAAPTTPSEPTVRKFIVTSQFAANEIITIGTGVGGGTGTATPTGDSITSLGGSGSAFNDDNRTRCRVNGDQLTKGTDAVWDSATTLHFSVIMDIGDTFEIEVAE